MIFAILGILVLVASFAIALVTLIREQGRLEDSENKSKVRPSVIKAAPVVGDDHDLVVVDKAEEPVLAEKPLVQQDVPEPAVDVDWRAGDGSVDLVDKPNVWWERLDGGADRVDEKDEDQKSIEKIREELAKLMSTKVNMAPEEKPAENNSVPELARSSFSSTLAGEFSLREIKKKD